MYKVNLKRAPEYNFMIMMKYNVNLAILNKIAKRKTIYTFNYSQIRRIQEQLKYENIHMLMRFISKYFTS